MNVSSVKVTSPIDPHFVTAKVNDLEEIDEFDNVSLDEDTGFANDTFTHIYGNCGEGTYDLPPLPPRPVGILKKTINRVSSFSRTRPIASIRPHLATDSV